MCTPSVACSGAGATYDVHIFSILFHILHDIGMYYLIGGGCSENAEARPQGVPTALDEVGAELI